MSVARGQRLAKRQPCGGSIGLGTSPVDDLADASAVLRRVRDRDRRQEHRGVGVDRLGVELL